MANVLKAMGVGKGDVVTIYLPRIPEVFFAMLACAKLGAIHSVVFAGYSSDALSARIDDSESKVVITADGSWINGKVFPMKKIVDDAVRFSPTVQNVIVVRHTATEAVMDPIRDHWYHELCKLPIAKGRCETVQVDAEDPLFILYTSGSTGKPKAILHSHGGYQVGTYATLHDCFDVHDADRWWCTSDPGWITGHSYLVYGPLLNGATVFMYEGNPTFPYPDRWWNLIERYGINAFYTAPTAIRTLMRFGEAWVRRHDLSSLRLLGSVGEPLNPEAWRWFHHVVGADRCPIIDTWWQTETGMFQIMTVPSMPQKPGSAGRPVFGQEAAVVDEEGREVPDGVEENLVLKRPCPMRSRGTPSTSLSSWPSGSSPRVNSRPTCASTWRRPCRRSPSRSPSISPSRCPRPARARSCAGCCGPGRWVRMRAICPPSPRSKRLGPDRAPDQGRSGPRKVASSGSQVPEVSVVRLRQ